MANVSERTKFFTESVIRRMTRISNEYNAVNLSQGFPDFEPPLELKEELQKAALNGPHQYAITWGAPNFLEALAKKQSRFMGIPIEPQKNIVVTCGSTEAMMAALMSVVNPNDKVIVFSPFYENYGADTILIGAVPIYVHLTPPSFSFDKKALREAFLQRPKAIIICNPGNPTGKVFSEDELLYIASLAEEFDTWVITDEVYEHIVYRPHKHTYFASLPNMFKRTISCSSLSKTYSITGWRLGYIIASEEVINAARKVHDFLTVGAAAPLQEAAVKALYFEDSYYEELLSHYAHKKELFLKLLDEANLKYIDPEGAYYVMVDISEFNVKDDVEFCEWLAREVGVAAVPGSIFFKENIQSFIRFHFAKKDETLLEAGKRLLRLRSARKRYV
ncbi:MAG: aminotransferase class I/II-fold pyridoxal phosphate-dependent enzyme [Campylobacteraceae bacterium]|jgi:aminotransferase|nr:aminotransferase class I/II-fold pyridoxal phosphate-dependent enzyme [Campylobacteraceae bacterium]